jgi:hypothetical protein
MIGSQTIMVNLSAGLSYASTYSAHSVPWISIGSGINFTPLTGVEVFLRLN